MAFCSPEHCSFGMHSWKRYMRFCDTFCVSDIKLTCQHLKLRVHIVTQTVLAILLVMMLTIACPSLSGPRPSSLTFSLLRSHHVVHPLTMVQRRFPDVTAVPRDPRAAHNTRIEASAWWISVAFIYRVQLRVKPSCMTRRPCRWWCGGGFLCQIS